MPTLVRPQIPRTSLQNEYIPITMFNAPWVWDPPEDLPATFDKCTENTLNRGEIDFSAANPDTVKLAEDKEFNLTRKLRMDKAAMENLPSALTIPTSLDPLTMSSRNCPKMPQKLTTNVFAPLHSLTSTGPFMDYKSMLTQVAAHAENGEIPPLTGASYEAVHTLPTALCADVPSFDAMDYIASLCHKGLAKEQPKLMPMGSRRMDFGEEAEMSWEQRRKSDFDRGSGISSLSLDKRASAKSSASGGRNIGSRQGGGNSQRPGRGSSVGRRSSAGSVGRRSSAGN